MARLKSFAEAQQRMGALNRRPPRVVPIAVRRIVGSVDDNQIAALRPNFLPRRYGDQDSRYQSVYQALNADVPLPAIEVYALGDAYYVVDGHHRVAATRALGQAYIDALVHEFLLPIAPLGGDDGHSCRPAWRAWLGWRRQRHECPCGELRGRSA